MIEQRFYKSVSANTVDTQDYVVTDTFTFTMKEIGGNSAKEPTCRVEVIWDPAGANQLLMATTGDTVQSSNLTFLGNGTKVLRIRLVNDDSVARTMGAYYLGEEH